MKKIWNIVLTGGPSGGKTSGLSYVQQFLTEQNYVVLTIPEAATYCIQNGIKPVGNGAIDRYLFEEHVMRRQLQDEVMFNQVAKAMDAEQIVILHDRGIMDDKSYVTDAQFRMLLQKNNLTEISAMDRYDAVFHMTTAADGAEEYYTLENNSARTETIEEAIKLDQEGINNWKGHQNFHVINNSSNFEKKLERLLSGILNEIGNPIPYSFQTKFLVSMPELKKLAAQAKCTKISMVQTYLQSDNVNIERKVIQRNLNGDFSYHFVEKQDITPIQRGMKSRIISEREYANLLQNADTKLHQIVKDRYCFMYDSMPYRLDIYPFESNKAILEVVTDGKAEVKIPPFIKKIRDVTNNNQYRNYGIANWMTLN